MYMLVYWFLLLQTLRKNGSIWERENEKNMFCDSAFSFLGVISGAFLLCKAVSFKIQILCFCTNESKWLTGYYGPKTIIKIMKHRIQKHICRKKYYCLGPYSPIISDFVCDGRPIGQNKCYLNVTRESLCLILAKKRDKMKIFALEFCFLVNLLILDISLRNGLLLSSVMYFFVPQL